MTRFTGPAGYADVAAGTRSVGIELAACATLALSACTSLHGEFGKERALATIACNAISASGLIGFISWMIYPSPGACSPALVVYAHDVLNS